MSVEVPISTILGRYVRLPSIRKSYRLACPLHGAHNTTTFHVTNDTLWFCFACHKGGDVVELLAALEGIERREAKDRLVQEFPSTPLAGLRQAANDMGWRLDKYRGEKPGLIQEPPTYPLLDSVRGISRAAVEHFGLRRVEKGVYFPLRDIAGALVGYSVRQEGTPKYLHSKGLRKQSILYGLYENLTEVRDTKEVVLVEGQFDMLKVWDSGRKNVSAVLGSSLAQKQARLLMPLVDRLVVLFDGDEAGRHGASDVQEKWGNTFDVKVLSLPEGEDPGGYTKLGEVLNV